MKKLASDRRVLAVLVVIALVVAAIGFSTTGHAMGLVTRIARMVGMQGGTGPRGEGSVSSSGAAPGARDLSRGARSSGSGLQREAAAPAGPLPTEYRLVKAGSFRGDLRGLPYEKPVFRERPEREPPQIVRGFYGPPPVAPAEGSGQAATQALVPGAPAPAPLITFDGLDFATPAWVIRRTRTATRVRTTTSRRSIRPSASSTRAPARSSRRSPSTRS